MRCHACSNQYMAVKVHAVTQAGRQQIEQTCACPRDQCDACRWCPDPQHELSPIR